MSVTRCILVHFSVFSESCCKSDADFLISRLIRFSPGEWGGSCVQIASCMSMVFLLHRRWRFLWAVCLSLGLLSVLGGRACAQSCDRTLKIYFRVGATSYDPDFRDNRTNMRNFVAECNAFSADSAMTRFSVDFYGGASPEGPARLNGRLAKERLDNAVAAMKEAGFDFGRFHNGGLHTAGTAIADWASFAESVSADSLVPERSEVLAVMKDTVLTASDKEKKLKTIRGGVVWNYLAEHVLPSARVFVAVVRCRTDIRIEMPAPVLPEPEIESCIASVPAAMFRDFQPAPAAIPAATPVADEWHRRLTVKTNALGLALLMGNAAAEIDITRNLSFNFPVYYSALNYFTSTVKFRTFAIQPELRWNFTRPEGLFVGAHFGLAYFNLAANGNWRIQTHNGDEPLLGGGVSLGYRLPLTRDRKWNVEFILGAGAYRFNYDRFYNEPNGALAGSVSRTYVGLDNAGVSFSYSFDLGRGRRR